MELIELIDLKIIDVRNIFFITYIFIDNNIPGPNAYKNNNKSLIGCNIYDSRFKSPSFITISKRFQYKNRNEGYPGPGSYIRFSEFGILAPKRDKDKEKMEKEDNKTKNENSNEELENHNLNNNENTKENENNNENHVNNENMENKNENEDLKKDEKSNEILETA